MLTIIEILLIIFIICTFLYGIYVKIDIKDYSNENKTSIQKASLTVAEVEESSKTISEVIENVNKSIVGISKIKNNGSSIFLKDSTSELGLGTGFIVSENGYIVTNEHVSGSKYSNCYITTENGKTYNANVLWSDSNLDLSIIKINAKELNYIKLGNSSEIKVGNSVYAIGNPIGYEFQRTVTSGIISAINRTIKFSENEEEIYMSDLIQTDATINPGNSGGPLINPDGSVIGVNSVKITSAEGIGFAMPIDVIKPIIEKYIQTGEFEEATLGIFAYDKDITKYFYESSKFNNGIYVTQVNKNSSAEKCGIKENDIILKIDGIELNKMSDLRQYIYKKNPGDEVELQIQRNKEIEQIKVKLGKK